MSELFSYPITHTTYDFIRLNTETQITERCSRNSKEHSSRWTTSLKCETPTCCEMEIEQFHRLRDLNGSKGPLKMTELFDLRPCYLMQYEDIWSFAKTFEHGSSSKSENDPLLTRYDLDKHGNSCTTLNNEAKGSITLAIH